VPRNNTYPTRQEGSGSSGSPYRRKDLTSLNRHYSFFVCRLLPFVLRLLVECRPWPLLLSSSRSSFIIKSISGRWSWSSLFWVKKLGAWRLSITTDMRLWPLKESVTRWQTLILLSSLKLIQSLYSKATGHCFFGSQSTGSGTGRLFNCLAFARLKADASARSTVSGIAAFSGSASTPPTIQWIFAWLGFWLSNGGMQPSRLLTRPLSSF